MLASHLINGEWVASPETRPSFDPATGAELGRFAAGGVAEAEAAIAAARRAFAQSSWAQNPRLRQEVLLEWANRLAARIEPIARLLSCENGKVLAQARGEVERSVSAIRYYAGLARSIRGHVAEIGPGEFATILREPVGVAGLIIPWNAPVNLLIRALAPALAAGCTTVIKPSPLTALVSAEVLATLHEVPSLPKGVVNMVLEEGHEVAQTLVRSQEVEMISFTGSTAIGQRIMADAAPTLKKLSLELGGKASCLIFEDAEPEAVAPHLVRAALAISGQQCVAARRILVHRSRLKAMEEFLRQAFAAVRIGRGLDTGVEMGPLITATAAQAVQARIEEAKALADRVLLSGGALEPGGAFLSPTLIAHSDSRAFFCQEEIFGPLVVLEGFETEAEAVGLANHSSFGLAASVWTRDGARAMRVARALADGVVWINDHGKLNAEAECGGYRRSGLGRLYGVESLGDFQEIKQIHQDTGVLVPSPI